MLETESNQLNKHSIIPIEPPINWSDISDFTGQGAILTIDKGKSGKKLKEPVNIVLQPKFNKADISLLNYIIEAFIGDRSKFINYIWNNESLKEVVRYYWLYKTGSLATIRRVAVTIADFTGFLMIEPDELIMNLTDQEDRSIPKAIKKLRKDIEAYQLYLKSQDYAPGSIRVMTANIKSWLEVNEIEIGKLPKPQNYVKYQDRSPKPEELQKLIDVLDLRGKVVVSMLALSGLRIGTLLKLKYKHIKEDLENGNTPICIQVSSEDTKGKYADYWTFIGKEAAEYLKLYIEARRSGTLRKTMPPEEINDESPLIIDIKYNTIKPVTPRAINNYLNRAMKRAGIIPKDNDKPMYDLRVHSLRKYFKTQLTANGVQSDYIEFMMGHKISTYHDIKSLGVDKLRLIYAKSGLSIKPQTKASKVDMLKEMVRSLGMDPEKVLVKDEIDNPHRTIISEDNEVELLQETMRDWIKKTLMEEK
ncbi:MAG: site-specific integrase [Archaeoglobaceae archaeon]